MICLIEYVDGPVKGNRWEGSPPFPCKLEIPTFEGIGWVPDGEGAEMVGPKFGHITYRLVWLSIDCGCLTPFFSTTIYHKIQDDNTKD